MEKTSTDGSTRDGGGEDGIRLKENEPVSIWDTMRMTESSSVA